MRRPAILSAAALLAGCAGGPPTGGPPPERLGEALVLFSADDALERRWRVGRTWGEIDWGLAVLDGDVAIRAAAAGDSGGLARYVEIDPEICPVVEWTWRVDALPAAADLASDAAEDMAASIFFAFGDPGSLTLPRPVPTLRYVWATEANPAESVVESPYFPVIRSLVVRSGAEGLGRTVTERRDLAADFEAAFGRPPDGPVEMIALYTDSDHGETPVEAWYLGARALCSEAPVEDLIL